MTALGNTFIKPVNEIFARNRLASRSQQPGETLDQYLNVLNELTGDCNFTAVSAEKNQADFVRDAYIRGLSSTHIRQRLLENLTLSLEQAHAQARSLEMAELQARSYLSNQPTTSALVDTATVNHPDTTPDHDTTIAAAYSKNKGSSRKCYFCGFERHQRSECPALQNVCSKCKKKGHYPRVCQSSKAAYGADKTAAIMGTISAASPACLAKALTTVILGGKTLNCLLDTGSSLSFIDRSVAEGCNLTISPFSGSVSMASSSLITGITGLCIAHHLQLLGHTYKDQKLLVMDNLCADVLIGHDFFKQHSAVTFTFGGDKPLLEICGLAFALVPPASLFANLAQNCQPIATKSRRHSTEDLKFIETEIEKLLTENIIERSNSSWRAQVFVVNNARKRRMVIDYSQTINKYTFLDAYPLPRVETIVEKVAKNSVFSTIDLRSAYHQIPILDTDREFTAFEACGKLYQFLRIPFGVTNGVPCFQKAIDGIIEAENLQGTYPYLDDVTICGRDQLEHDRNLERFMNAVKKYRLTINQEKSTFSVKSIKLLGYEISDGKMKPDPDRLKPLLTLPVPDSAKTLQRAIGMFAHYSRWIPRYSDKIRPLVQAKNFPLSKDVIETFDSLKSDIAKATIQAIDDSALFQIETDASDHAIAGILTQNGRPVAFFSRTLNHSEQKHPAIEKEAYAIIESIKHWRHFLLGRHFRLLTDQKSVAYMFDMTHKSKIKNEKIMRWRLELTCYTFDILYRPGRENKAADTYSRDIASSIPSMQDLKTIHGNLCHPGVRRMLHWVRSKNLPFSIDDIRRVTSSCSTCAKLKPRFHQFHGTLVKATAPMERLNIDFKGPLPGTSTGKRYLLTIVDEYSRFPFAYPCADMSTATVIKNLHDLFTTFGLPGYVHSDRGANFMSSELKGYLHTRGIATSRTTAYNPQGNGQIERFNGIIWKTIELALDTQGLKHTQWDIVLQDALHAIRSLLCTATNTTPHERMFSYHRRSSNGASLPSWLTEPGKILMRRHVRGNKYSPAVDEVDLIEANPEYALVRLPDGREENVSLRHLAPYGEALVDNENSELSNVAPPSSNLEPTTQRDESPLEQLSDSSAEEETPRRSSRIRTKPNYLNDYVLN